MRIIIARCSLGLSINYISLTAENDRFFGYAKITAAHNV